VGKRKEMEDAINDLEEQTPKAVTYERCVTAIMLIPEMLGEKTKIGKLLNNSLCNVVYLMT
jgi:hypothetical protein